VNTTFLSFDDALLNVPICFCLLFSNSLLVTTSCWDNNFVCDQVLKIVVVILTSLR